MKRLLSVFVLLAMVLSICLQTMTLPVEAASIATSGYLTYTYSGYTARITDCNHKAVGYMSIPSTLSGKSVVSIEEYAFQNCISITGFDIPDTVTDIGSGAFMSCCGAVRITLPAGLTSISESMFQYCSSLKYITMGDQIKQIRNYAFSGCSSLSEITIPHGVTYIGDQAFCNCTSLETVIIPSTVTSIGSDVFLNCENLTKIIYCGTEAQWKKIYVKGTNTVLKSADLQYHLPEGGTCTTSPNCAICGEVAGDPLGHSGEWMELVPVTCVQNGIYARICAVCGITESKNIEAIGHQGEWQDIQIATCVQNGIQSRICSVCNIVETITFPALGHTNESKVIAATCTEQGYTNNICTICGNEEKTDFVAALGHNWSDWIQVLAPSCNAEGSRVRFCNCGTKETEPVAKLPHTGTNEACPTCAQLNAGTLCLEENLQMDLTMEKDLCVDLNGFSLSGTIITNGFKVYGMDSATNDYACDAMGYFSCVDETGNAIVPESLCMMADGKRYMTIDIENGYTFHRFYLGITHVSLDPAVVGFGYKAAFYGDSMAQGRISSIGYNLWLTENRVLTYSSAFKNTLTLRLKNFDVGNYGETPVNASVTMTLVDGTVIESATASYSMRQVVESINDATEDLSETQLAAVIALIAQNPPMEGWKVENLVK